MLTKQLFINLSVILFHLTPLSFILVAWIVVRSPRKMIGSSVWVLFCILTALAWTGAVLVAFHTPLPVAKTLGGVCLILASLGALTYYYFVLTFLELLPSYRKSFYMLIGYEVVLLYFFLTTDLFYHGVVVAANNVTQPRPGPLIGFYVLYVLYIFSTAIYLSYRKYRQSSGQKRLPLLYFFYGTIIIFLSALGSMLPFSPSTSFLVWLPSSLTIAYPLIISYAMIQHRLWDIRTIAHKTLFWFVISALCIAPFYLLFSYFLPLLQRYPLWLLVAIIALYFLLLLVSRNIQPIIDQYFDRRVFSQRNIIDSFVRDMRQLQGIESFARSLNHTLHTKLHIATSRILLRPTTDSPLLDMLGKNTSLDKLPAISPPPDHAPETVLLTDSEHSATPPSPAVQQRSETKHDESSATLSASTHSSESTPVSVSERPPWLDAWLIQQDRAIDMSAIEEDHVSATQKQALVSYLEAQQIIILLPLSHRGQLLGLIELGEKSDLKPYTVEDFTQLESIRDAVAVALHNTLLFQDLQKKTQALDALATDLEQRVQKRTLDYAIAKQETDLAYQKLQYAEQARTRFFNNVTHELRTPLSLILAPLNDLLAAPSPSSDCTQHTLQLMHRQAHLLQHFIDDLLENALFETRRDNLNIQSFSLAQDLEATVQEFAPLAQQKHISLLTKLQNDLPPLYGDRHQLKRVWMNLLSNALKYTEKGHISVRCYETSECLVCEVQDTGVGIPRSQQKRIFQRFTRVSQEHPSTSQAKGSGLGLAIVQEIVQQHHGSIEVESEPQQGSLFRICLRKGFEHFAQEFATKTPPSHPAHPVLASPQVASDDPNQGALDLASHHPPEISPNDLKSHHFDGVQDSTQTTTVSATVSPPDPPIHHHPETLQSSGLRPQIMVVEDNTDMRTYIQHILETQYDVLVAQDGQEALDILGHVHPNLIVSDVMMPRMDGRELCQRIKSSPATAAIPVLLLTAQSTQEQVLLGFHLGADDYVTKPFRSQELLARIHTHLKIKQMTQQIAVQEKVTLMGLLSAGLAHEVKNPANAILHSVSPLRLMTQSVDENTKKDIFELLDVVYESAERITALSNNLLELASPHNTALAPWDVKRAIDMSLRILQFNHPKTDEVHLSLQHEALPHGVRSQLNQIVVNLLNNALRATEKKGEIWVETTSTQTHFVLTVRDTGVGITPQHLPKIFEPLFTTADVGQGTGLGLYLCQKIVHNHHGEIFVQSRYGEGSTFRIVLPLPSPT